MADGQGCRCAAHSENECGCGADWTTQETLDLRARIKELESTPTMAAVKDMIRDQAVKENEALAAQNAELQTAADALLNHNIGLATQNVALRKALTLILPLAKGYAADHPVGNNAKFCDEAAEALAIPDLSSGVLKKRDAMVLRDAARFFFESRQAEWNSTHICDVITELANDLEGEQG